MWMYHIYEINNNNNNKIIVYECILQFNFILYLFKTQKLLRIDMYTSQ